QIELTLRRIVLVPRAPFSRSRRMCPSPAVVRMFSSIDKSFLRTIPALVRLQKGRLQPARTPADWFARLVVPRALVRTGACTRRYKQRRRARAVRKRGPTG